MAAKRTAAQPTAGSGQNDRRVRKTTSALREALHALILEKPYDEIVVKEILDRADVGRSTFYTHFQDKDELLASAIDEIIRSAESVAVPRSGPWYERIVWFSQPILEYHERQRVEHSHALPLSARTPLHAHLNAALVNLIERSNSPSTLVTKFVASTFILVFTWWLDEEQQRSAAEADGIFRSLVLPSLRSIDNSNGTLRGT